MTYYYLKSDKRIFFFKLSQHFNKQKKVKKKKIAVVADHAGFYLKEKLVAYLIREKYDVRDFGCLFKHTIKVLL